MEQSARIEDGRGNIIVQAVASSVAVGLPPQLKLTPRHRRKRVPKPGIDIDLLSRFISSIAAASPLGLIDAIRMERESCSD